MSARSTNGRMVERVAGSLGVAEAAAAPRDPERDEVSRIVLDGCIYVRKMKRCGKPHCRSCPHGPYWYRLVSQRQGRRIERYVGRDLSAALLEERLLRLIADDDQMDLLRDAIGSDEVERERPRWCPNVLWFELLDRLRSAVRERDRRERVDRVVEHVARRAAGVD